MNKLVTTLESSYVVWIHLFLYSPWPWMQPLPFLQSTQQEITDNTQVHNMCFLHPRGHQHKRCPDPPTQTLARHEASLTVVSLGVWACHSVCWNLSSAEVQKNKTQEAESMLGKVVWTRVPPKWDRPQSVSNMPQLQQEVILSCFFYGTFWLLFVCGVYFYVLYVSLTPTAGQAKGWASSEILIIGKLVLVGIFH